MTRLQSTVVLSVAAGARLPWVQIPASLVNMLRTESGGSKPQWAVGIMNKSEQGTQSTSMNEILCEIESYLIPNIARMFHQKDKNRCLPASAPPPSSFTSNQESSPQCIFVLPPEMRRLQPSLPSSVLPWGASLGSLLSVSSQGCHISLQLPC